MKGDKTMSKSDKDYVYDSLIDIQATVDDLVEYMEADDGYEEEDSGNWVEDLISHWFLFVVWAVVWIILQATFTLIKQL